MDSTLLFLKEEANRIKELQNDNFYLNYTQPMNIPIKSFLNLFKIIKESKDNDLILGFCFSIGPYISNNRLVIKNNFSHEIWTNLITFSEIINEPIQVLGFCEAVLTASFYFLSIDQTFLDFLIDTKPLQSKILKPSLLISLYSDFQFDFIPLHSKSLIPIITNYFEESVLPIHCILNLYLVNSMNLNSDEFKNFPNFEKNLWSSLYRVISNDPSYFRTLLHPFYKFRKMNESFFNRSNEFISNKIDEIEKNSYEKVNMNKVLTLAYLMPFFSIDDVEKFLRKIIPIVCLYIVYIKKIPKELTDVLNESRKLLGIYSVAMKIYSVCSNLLETEFYPAVIYFISIFLNAFNSHYPQCYNAIIEKIANGLESSYPIKFPLAFAFFENIQSMSAMIHEEQNEAKNEKQNEYNKKHECCHHNHKKESENANCYNHQHNHNHNQSENENEGSCECCHHHKKVSENTDSCCCNHHHNQSENEGSCECCHHQKKVSENTGSCCCNHQHNDDDDDYSDCCHHNHDGGCCCHYCAECIENSELYRFDSAILKSRVVPSLLKISCSKNEADCHWSFKALRSFLTFDLQDFLPSVSNLYLIFSLHSESEISNQTLFRFHQFYKFLFDYINSVESNESQLSEVINFIFNQLSFIKSNSENFKNQESIFYSIKADFCILIHKICTIDSSCISKFYDFGMEFANELYFSDYFKSYPFVLQLVSLFYNSKKSSDKEFVNKIRPFVDHSIKIGKSEVHSCPSIQSEVVSHLTDFDFVKFSDISSIIENFISENDKETKDAFNFIALQIIEEFLKRLSIDEQQHTTSFDLIVSPFIDSICTLLRSSSSEKVVNKTFSILTIILDTFSQDKIIAKSDKKLIEYFEDVILVTLLGRIRLFDHSMCYNYGFLTPNFKFFSFASHFIAKFTKNTVSRRISDDFSLWILRVSSEVVPKILKVLEISVAVKIIDSESIEFLSAAVISIVNEENWSLKFVQPCVSFLMKLKEKFPKVFTLDLFLTCIEKAWEENQDDNPEIVQFLIPVFLQTFSEKSFNISGDFLVFQDISMIVAAQSIDLNYPQILNYYIKMHQNKVPFDSFDRCAAVVFAFFLTKSKSDLTDAGFGNEELKTMHMQLKQIFKNNKTAERFVDNYFADNQVVSNRLKSIKKSPKLPEF